MGQKLMWALPPRGLLLEGCILEGIGVTRLLVRCYEGLILSLSNVGLNSPPQTQHNEGVGGYNEDKSNAAIKVTRGRLQLSGKFQQ